MMARRAQHRGREEGRSSTCELLLRKLRDGQEQLRGSIRVLKEPSLCGTGGRLAVHRDSARKSPTACVRNLPMKRARTVLLSPEPSVCLLHGIYICKYLKICCYLPTKLHDVHVHVVWMGLTILRRGTFLESAG